MLQQLQPNYNPLQLLNRDHKVAYLLPPQEMCILLLILPSSVAQLPTAHSQAMPPPASIQDDGNSPVAHLVAAINAAASIDDASPLSGMEKGDAKSTRLLHNYFLSLQQSGTTRTPWMMFPLSVELKKKMSSPQDYFIIIFLVSSSLELQEL